MPSNINIKVGSAKGTCEKPDKKDWIQVQSWQWGMTLPTKPDIDRQTHGRAAVQEFVFTKLHDKASGDLMKYLVSGKVFTGGDDVVFTMTATHDNKENDFLTIKFTNCIVASVQMDGGSVDHGDRVSETVTLRFSAFKYEYVADGEQPGTCDCEYDVRTMTR
jgi:type VI secretion system secreted protein Hcp